MALRNQPYLPLYIQDFLTDEKLIECSAKAHGVYIRLLCVMHKSEEYGTILLNKKYRHLLPQCHVALAHQLSKQMPYPIKDIEEGLYELFVENVLESHSTNKFIFIQRRMVRDNALSIKRAKAGSKGGSSTSSLLKQKCKQNASKTQANSEYEYEYEYETESKKKEGSMRGENIPSEFLEAMKLFPGPTRKTDNWVRFKKHKDWKEALPLLKSAIESEIKHKATLNHYGKWVEDWSHFATWINQRRWEQTLTLPPGIIESEELANEPPPF